MSEFGSDKFEKIKANSAKLKAEFKKARRRLNLTRREKFIGVNLRAQNLRAKAKFT